MQFFFKHRSKLSQNFNAEKHTSQIFKFYLKNKFPSKISKNSSPFIHEVKYKLPKFNTATHLFAQTHIYVNIF